MRRNVPAVVLVVASVFLSACATESSAPTTPDAEYGVSASVARDAQDVPGVFNTQLRATNEVAPTVTTSVAKGSAQLKVADDNSISFKVVIDNLAGEQFVAAHIHRAPATANGGIVADFVLTGFSAAELRSEEIVIRGTVTPRTGVNPAVLAERLRDETDQYYVNVHSATNRGGAIRGQLR